MSDSEKTSNYTTIRLGKKHFEEIRAATAENSTPIEYEEGTIEGVAWFRADDLVVILEEE